MGKKLDALLRRRGFKTAKFKTLVSLAISRLAVLKNHRQVRCSQARSDVSQLINLSHQDRALLRVEQVIKEQNMLDVFIMIEGYCHIVLERLVLIENNKECPDELLEAISSLIFAASRCGEFPELQEIRSIFTSRYGKEFAARAVELRSNCGVNHKMIQKLSTRQPSLESRQKVLKDIAAENGITLQLEEETPVITTNDDLDMSRKQNQKQPENDPPTNLDKQQSAEIDQDENFSGSMKTRKYRDVASAAQAAFESAAYAAAAARAAVELSRSGSQDKYFDEDEDDDQSRPTTQQRNRYESPRFRVGKTQAANTGAGEAGSDVENIRRFQPIYQSSSESEVEEELPQNLGKFHPEESKERKNNKEKLRRSFSDSSSDSDGGIMKDTKVYTNVLNKSAPSEEIFFDNSDNETGNQKGSFAGTKHSSLTAKEKTIISKDEYPNTRQNNAYMQSGEQVHDQRLNIERKPISMRTRQGNRR